MPPAVAFQRRSCYASPPSPVNAAGGHLPVALPLRILLLADDLALGALRLHTASDKRLGQAHIPWEAWTLVQVIKAGHASQQPLAVVPAWWWR
eukprot:366245-Chlamydomonas_euryale.AAC.17